MQAATASGFNSVKRLFYHEDGISFIECALVASLVAVVGGMVVLAFGKL